MVEKFTPKFFLSMNLTSEIVLRSHLVSIIDDNNLNINATDIEKTLGALDNVLEYYHVAEEVEPAIREG